MEFKPFDKVLVRDVVNELWHPNIFLYIEKSIDKPIYPFVCARDTWAFCIPYEGNEHLMGTTNSYIPKWEPKKGELILASNDNKEWFPVFFKNKMCEPHKNIKYACNCVLFNNDYTCWKAFNYIKPFKQENM